MRNVLIVLVVLAMFWPAITVAAQEAVTWGTQPPTTAAPANPDTPVVTNEEPQRKMGSLTRRQRRKLGLTIWNVLRITKQMKKSGELEGMSQSEIAVTVLDQLTSENPKAFASAQIDWDAILDFIERLIPLIMKIIALFGGI